MKHSRNYSIHIDTITPVSIGNGELLSPYTDFVFEEDKIHILDKEEVAKSIPDHLMDEYVSSILNSFDNNRSNFSLKSFLEREDKLALTPADYSKQSVAYYGLSERDRREVKCTVKNAGSPYISGSTLKGAMKSAILYNWLRKESKKKDSPERGVFDHLMKEVLQTFNKCRRELESIERIASKRFVSRDDRSEIRKLKGQVKRKGVRDLARSFDNVFNELLTKNYRYFPRAFSQFKVSDSQPISPENTIFQLTNRLHYRKGEVSIPANLESIRSASKTTFDLHISDEFRHKGLHFLNEEQAMEKLFKQINKFHKDNIDLELDLLDRHEWYDKANPRDLAIFDHYQNFLETTYDKIDKAIPNEAYLCLGFGKSFFYNSIGMLVFDWDESKSQLSEEDRTLFKKYCQLFFLGRDGQRNFPVTRTVTHEGLPMGWVKLVWKV